MAQTKKAPPPSDPVATAFFTILVIALIAGMLAIAGVFKSATQPYREPDIRTVSGTPLSRSEVNRLASSLGLEGRVIRENLPHGLTLTANLATASGNFEVISTTSTARNLGFYLTEEKLLQAIGLLEELAEHQPIISEELQRPHEEIRLRLATSRYSQHILVFPGGLNNFDSWSDGGPTPGKIKEGIFGEWLNQDVHKENEEFLFGRWLFSHYSLESEALYREEEGFLSSPEGETEEEPSEELLSAGVFYQLLCEVTLQEDPASPATERLQHMKPVDFREASLFQEVSQRNIGEICNTQGVAMANAASSTPVSYRRYTENARSEYSSVGLVSAADYERYSDRLAP